MVMMMQLQAMRALLGGRRHVPPAGASAAGVVCKQRPLPAWERRQGGAGSLEASCGCCCSAMQGG